MNSKNKAGIIVLICGIMTAKCAGAAIEIWAPRQANPAFAEPGKDIIAEIRGDAGLSASLWSASLENDLRTWNCSVTYVAYGIINRGTENGWNLTVRVPADAPPELFKLNISHTAGGSASWINSVSVVRDFETSFYIIQLTDEQIDKDAAVEANGHRSAGLIGWAAPVVNLINPRLVLNTGDEVDDAWTNTDNKFTWYTTAKTVYRVPCVTVKGNNDDGVNAKWESCFGQRSFSFIMGSFYVLAHDFTDGTLKTWAASDYNTNWNDPSIKYRLIAQHAWTDANPSAFIPDTDKPCDLMLMGHTHANGIKQSNPYYAVYTQSAENYANGGFFEFVKSGSGWSCSSPLSGHAGGSDNIQLVGDWGAARVSAAHALPDDGTQTANTITVLNKIQRNFYDGRVRFLLASGRYAVNGGEKIAEYGYAGGTKTAVLARVNIPQAGASDATVTLAVIKTGPAQIRITSLPFSISCVETSPAITVEAQDGAGSIDGTFGGTVSLVTASPAGSFSVSSTEWNNIDAASLVSGTAVFYYRDRIGGFPVITVSRPDLELCDTQAWAVVQPVISIVKSHRNSGSDTPGTAAIPVSAGDALEYTITVKNNGTETATEIVILDAKAFDTCSNNPVSFIGMDTFPPADSWAYTSDPGLGAWHSWGSVPYFGQEDVKGLRWKIAMLGAEEEREIRFSVRVR
ncbi:hypothetical protein AUJ67_00605 [Candidatus Desantisbacteria bacterium CG1_02_49_89]|nr:MAG: hypothetical protein AUJ67_00605 [Candidatus Desantisbacteria bacterium CG1_02_49_89]